jgi:chorismate-pyruvate lyase
VTAPAARAALPIDWAGQVVSGPAGGPTDLEPVRLDAIGAALRVLLLGDGTVTTSLQSLHMEPVRAEHIETTDTDPDEHWWTGDGLGLTPGSVVRQRKARIVGARSGAVYLTAVSTLVLDRVPAGVLAALDGAPRGLGQALIESEVESRRELLWVAREPSGELTRAYRIVIDGQAAIGVRETFTLAAVTDVSHGSAGDDG